MTHPMQRIMIIGGPGSGKSTLARILGDRLALPVYHMDREVHWLPGWVERAQEDKPALVYDIITRAEWVFEGGNATTYQARLDRADLLIWLDVPIWLRLLRVVRRSIVEWGKERADLQDGCAEDPRMLPEFIGFIWRTRKRSRGKMQALFETAHLPKHRLAWLPQVHRFVQSLPLRSHAQP